MNRRSSRIILLIHCCVLSWGTAPTRMTHIGNGARFPGIPLKILRSELQLAIRTLRRKFPAQAQFTFRPTNTSSLEVPYRINGDFGLTSISDAVRERMNNAGYDSTVEAFVYINEAIVSKP